jgi:hypothetical protein
MRESLGTRLQARRPPSQGPYRYLSAFHSENSAPSPPSAHSSNWRKARGNKLKTQSSSGNRYHSITTKSFRRCKTESRSNQPATRQLSISWHVLSREICRIARYSLCSAKASDFPEWLKCYVRCPPPGTLRIPCDARLLSKAPKQQGYSSHRSVVQSGPVSSIRGIAVRESNS